MRFLRRRRWDFVAEATFPEQAAPSLIGAAVTQLQAAVRIGYLVDVFWIVWADREDCVHFTALVCDDGMHDDGGVAWWSGVTRGFGTSVSPYFSCPGLWQWLEDVGPKPDQWGGSDGILDEVPAAEYRVAA